MFQDGSFKTITSISKAFSGTRTCAPRPQLSACSHLLPPAGVRFPLPLSPQSVCPSGPAYTADATLPSPPTHKQTHIDSLALPAFNRFPFDNFTYSLTLFSKFFSSFPHGTCSLSVSRHYLALDGIYHPFWSAFPNKPTRPMSLASPRTATRDSHPL